jgi:hypothetical protein
VSEANAWRLDRALERTGRSYVRLSSAERARLHETASLLLPGERLSRYALNDAQARAMVFLAFDDDDRGGRPGRDRDDDRPRACAASIDRISRDAGWIHQAIAPLRRASHASLGRERELEVLDAVEERARQVAVAASRCGPSAARDKAGDLLDLARGVAAKHRQGITSAWMSVGDDRLARLQALAREVEREALRGM